MRLKYQREVAAVVISAAWLAAVGCSTPSHTQSAGQSLAGVVTKTATKTATVESIDSLRMTLMLRNPDGSLTGYVCRPEVRNFDQIKIGDKVTFTTTEETVVSFRKGGALPGVPAPTTIDRAPAGAKPGGKIVDSISYFGKAVKVDALDRTVTVLTGAAGVLETVKVSRDVNLATVKPGDAVGVRVTQTSVITVESP